MTRLIPLPSGYLINPDHITLVRESPHSPEYIDFAVIGGDKWMAEKITLKAFQELLQVPQSPLVDPVVNLSSIKVGAACSFLGESGETRHGVIDCFAVIMGVPHIVFSSHGESFSYCPVDGVFTKE